MNTDLRLIPTGVPNEYDVKRGVTFLARIVFLGPRVIRFADGYLYPKEKQEAIRLFNENGGMR